MFRIIRKWYFKLYHLFRFLGIFILIFGFENYVYAEEYNECFDEYKVGNITLNFYTNYFERIKPSIQNIKPNTTYYVRFFPSEKYTCGYGGTCFGSSPFFWDINSQRINDLELSNINFDIENQILSFKTPNNENIYYLGLTVYKDESNYQVLNNAVMIISENESDVLSCPGSEEPEPGENSVYSTFLTLYIDRISYLAKGFTENPYLLAMIGIIFSFIVLELFLKILHLKGGKYK